MTVLVDVELPGVWLDALALDADAAALRLVNRNPEPGEVEVPLSSTIVFTILDTTSGGTVDSVNTRVYVNDVLAFDGSAIPNIQAPFFGARANITLLPALNGQTIALDPIAPFSSEELVTVRVVSRTTESPATSGIDVSWTFTAADLTAPRIVAVQATGHRTVRITFDEDMDASVALATFALAATTAPAVTPVVLGAQLVTTRSVELSLAADLTPNVPYTVTVTGADDMRGNAIVAPYNVATFIGYTCSSPLGRNFDLLRMLPVMNRRADLEGTGDLRKFIACVQEVTDLLLCDVDAFADILDPDTASEGFVDAMLEDLGNPFAFDLSLTDKRRLLSVLVPLYQQKGTEPGVKNAVRFFLGLEVSIAPYTGDEMLLGEAELGVDWTLGPSGSFSLYAFDVVSAIALTDEQRARLRSLVDYMKPAHTHFMYITEPVIPVLPDHVELGLSELGDTWILH